MISAQEVEETALLSPLHVGGAKVEFEGRSAKAASVTLGSSIIAPILVTLLCHSALGKVYREGDTHRQLPESKSQYSLALGTSFLTPFQGQAAMDQAEHFLRNSRRKCRQKKSFG